ncbi:MAG: alpha/beta hydrolase [Candidatus Lokiarchaeota archaeon]|nr:alpha/beta hydrolase [Candidatus Lokiarchaeota archaeon]
MKHIEGEFEGIESLTIYYQAWIPDNPKAIVQVVHGFAEHSGRYLNIVNQLLPLDYAVYANDHRGHGKSEGRRNYVDSFNQFIEDEKLFYDLIKDKYQNLPIFMLGHSMGSMIALFFANKYESLLKGLILSGTGTGAGESTSKATKVVVKLLAKIIPKKYINPGLKAEKLSHDPEVVQAYENDPLVNADKIALRLGWELMNCFSKFDPITQNLKLPLLVQCGAEDSLIKGSEEALKNAFKMKDKSILIYDGLYHEVYNESKEERKKVLNDLSSWLDNHL